MLTFSGVSKYFGGMKAVSDVSFGIEQGAIHALIGPNGAGKTTLFNLATGLVRLSGGQVLFGEHPLASLEPHQICRLGIARTFQNIRLFRGMTAIETVAVGTNTRFHYDIFTAMLALPRKRRNEKKAFDKAEEILDFVGLKKKSNYLCYELSYGEQRLLEIARALATGPKLLLLDEPTAGMTETETENVSDLIKSISQKGITVFFIEHDMRFVMGLSSKVTVLNFGTLIANGPPQEVQNNEAVIQAYLGRGGALNVGG